MTNNKTKILSNNKVLNYNFKKNNISAIGFADSATLTYPSASVSKPTKGGKNIWYLPENLNTLLGAFFKSIYCLISKPKYINSPDKLIIEILYYITIPDQNIFKWYNFIYNNKNYNRPSRVDAPASASPLSLGVSCTREINNGIGLVNQASAPVRESANKNLRKILKTVSKIRRKKSIRIIFSKNFKITRTLFNLNNSNIANIYLNKFTYLFKILSNNFNKPIEFNLIRLHKSDYDSNILAQLFILIIKKKNIKVAINKLFNKNNINTQLQKKQNNNNIASPSYSRGKKLTQLNYATAIISGLYIHIGGRLMREPIIPRLTTKKFEMGAIATGKVNFLDSARITKKNKKGAYTIKIAYAQNLIK